MVVELCMDFGGIVVFGVVVGDCCFDVGCIDDVVWLIG